MNNIPAGYRLAPGIPYFASNEEGKVFNLKTKREAAIHYTNGYNFVNVHHNGKTLNYYVHRLVALAFIPIPEEVIQATDSPEVNHIDGDKDNNAVSNLEWVTAKQNIQHSIDTGLAGFKKVLSKNLLTDEIVKYPSYHEVCRHFGVSTKKMKRHLDSGMAGTLTKNYWAFKYENDIPWPELEPGEIIEDRWERSYGIWVAEKDGKQFLAGTLQHLCESLGVKYYSVQPEVRADGKMHKVLGFGFWYSNLPTKAMLDSVEYVPDNKFRPVKKVKVFFIKTNTQLGLYDSLTKACKQFDAPVTTILYAITKRNGVYEDLRFEYE